MPLWLAAEPLVLASKSAARRALLEAAGIPLEVRPAEIDERATEAGAAAGGAEAAAALLARAKALDVGARMRGGLVLGADQTLALGARRFSKPADRTAAAEQLRALRGQTHALHSAVALARDGKILFEHGEAARLTMRVFSDTFLDDYLATAGSAVTASVGGYQLEGAGIQLFERIEGDYFTILGLPLLPLLAFLRSNGYLAK
ncbi:MAG: nucleoside triphosphate pyrophosphatase [Alphaproteobacteria bacterium]|jgi:septum formation protein|nr:nucleoside triphosphate pyrophosphatase [Alphaproteobacteria bacterium]